MANVDKSIYQAPQGVVPAMPGEPLLEIEIENPDDVRVNGQSLMEGMEPDFDENIAERMEEGVLQRIAADLMQSIKEDIQARKDWEKMYIDGINLLGLKYEERTEPWQGACGVFHPLITEAVIRFQADTIMETFPASGPVKTQIIGKVTEDKEDAAERVEADMNWQVTENMPEFRPEHERLLWNLPSAGCGFKKVYDCPILERQTSVFVPAEDIIIPYGTTDLLTCERIAHRMKKNKIEVAKLQRRGFWRDVDLPDPPVQALNDIQKKKDKETGVTSTFDLRNTFYEVAVDLDLNEYERREPDEVGEDEKEELGNTLPYVVTICEHANTVLSIRRNWRKNDAQRLKRLHFVQYNYIPGYGAYGFGLFHLLGGFATSATSIMRQLVDAGTLSNLPGGLKSKGLRIKGDDTPVAPGEFRDVDVGSGTIRDNILPLPYKEPSATLYNLLINIVEEGRRFAATNDIKVADMSSQAPVGTTLAVLERQLRTMTAVQARVHYSLKQELRLIADIIKDNLDENSEYTYEVDAPDGRRAKLKDYSYVSIIPVSDPNAATMSQRVVQYQAVIQLAQLSPQIYDQPELHRQMLTVLGIKNVGKLVPTEDDIKIVDPVQENHNILIGRPVRAHYWQDHESHLRVHMAAMQDPLVQQLVGQNPKAQQILGSMTSHIADHVGHAYRVKMQQAMGMPLPVLGKDDSLPEQVEVQLSRMLAQAAPMVLQQSQQLVAQQQAQKNAQDPVLVAQMMEQQNAREEIERKKRKDAIDAQLEQQKIQIDAVSKGVDPQILQAKMSIEQQKVQAQMMLEQQKAAAKAVLEQQKLRGQQEKNTLEMQMAMAREQTSTQQQAQSSQIGALKDTLDIASKQHQMWMASEKHAQELKLKREKQAADIAAKKAKNKPNGDKKT